MIQQYIDNPQLIDQLTPEQKVNIYQQLQQKEKQLHEEKIKLQTQLETKQKEQQNLFTQLQQLTNKTTLPEIQQFISTIQQQFDTDLKSILTQYQQLTTPQGGTQND